MKEQKEAIRQACIKANPSILDLKFGCKFKIKKFKLKRQGEPEIEIETTHTVLDTNYEFDGERHHIKGVIYVASGTSSYPTTKERKLCFENFEESDRTSFEIIGRDIHLADIIVAVGHNWVRDRETGNYELGQRLTKLIAVYNPFKDTLDEQSPETIEFIYNLIK